MSNSLQVVPLYGEVCQDNLDRKIYERLIYIKVGQIWLT